jgi:hypothetical protein
MAKKITVKDISVKLKKELKTNEDFKRTYKAIRELQKSARADS